MIRNAHRRPPSMGPRRGQRGVATLMVALVILVILTIIVLASANVAFFEQRTTNNQYRAQMAGNSAEYSLDLAGEYMKASRARLNSDGAKGWLDKTVGGAANKRWVSCAGIAATNTNHPCMAEASAARRDNMFYYTSDGKAELDPTSAKLNLPYGSIITNGQLTATGGGGVSGAEFAVDTSRVHALLCRIEVDRTDPAKPLPTCSATPSTSKRYVVVILANASMDGEGANAWVRETLGTFSTFGNAANVPLVASGFVKGLGNAEIVTSPNAGGFGIPASIWAPTNVDVDGSVSGGIGSIVTCHLGEFLKTKTTENFLDPATGCPSAANACGCPGPGSSGFLSGHSALVKVEGVDILDMGDTSQPKVDFYPGEPYDDGTDIKDDSLFEWVFDRDVVAEGQKVDRNNCPNTLGNTDCAVKVVVDDMQAKLTDCSAAGLNAASTGIYYSAGTCNIEAAQVGSPENPVVLVVEEELQLNSNTVFYGMIFVRSANGTGIMKGSGGPQIYGAIIVEGDVDIAGGMTLVYSDEVLQRLINSPAFTRFGRIPGSWLDARNAF